MSVVKYSVIVPAYNAGKTIGDCLGALTRQSLVPAVYEIIVVDDGSKDGTAEIVKTFSVRYLRQANRGPATARNHGAREARGEIILFTDSDCVPSADWIAEMTKPFGDPDVVAVKGAYRTNQRSLDGPIRPGGVRGTLRAAQTRCINRHGGHVLRCISIGRFQTGRRVR